MRTLGVLAVLLALEPPAPAEDYTVSGAPEPAASRPSKPR